MQQLGSLHSRSTKFFKKCNQKFLNTACALQLQSSLYFVLYCEFFKSKSTIMNIRRKDMYKIPKNFLIVDSQILQMKNEMSRFTSVSYFARCYPMTLQSSKVALLENEREISVFVFDSSENELSTINKN